MKTPFLGGAYLARSVNIAAQRCVNLFPEKTEEGGKDVGAFFRCPGLLLLATVGTGPIRGERVVGSFLYVVSGSELYQIDAAWNAILVGTGISGSGPVSMPYNGTQLAIATDPDGYIYDIGADAFASINDPDFPGAQTMDYVDGYFLFNDPDTQHFYITAINDGTNIDALDFANAEGAPDPLISVLVDHREAWLFGGLTTEVWVNSGNSDFPFARLDGAFIEHGIAAPHARTKLDNSVFWLGKDENGEGMVWRAEGYRPTRISSHGVEFAIASYSRIDDAIMFSYQQEGHSFVVLIFPTANATWVFDVSTGLWHERAYFDPNTSAFGRHRANCHAFFNGKHVVGDYQNGKLYEWSLSTYSDNGDAQKWLRSWRALPPGKNNPMKTTFHHGLQIDCETGVGLVTGQGSDPKIMLRWSDDGGHNWSNEYEMSMGKIGKTRTRAVRRRLGSTKKGGDRVYEISGTDPVKIALTGAELEIS